MGGRGGRRRRWILVGLGLGVVFTLALAGVYHRPIVSRIVTRMALRDAARLAPRDPDPDVDTTNRAFHDASSALWEKYGPFFRRGYIDRDLLIDLVPLTGPDENAIHAFLVLSATPLSYNSAGQHQAAAEELMRTVQPFYERARPKEALVGVLTSGYALSEGGRDVSGALKNDLYELFFERDYSGNEDWVAARREIDWAPVLRDLEHPREKVRAGALLLLYRHPFRELMVERARAALADPSGWVRLAAAGILAHRGDGAGTTNLLAGLAHPRWEVRWWCGRGLTALGKRWHAGPLRLAALFEPDRWVRGQLWTMREVLREAP